MAGTKSFSICLSSASFAGCVTPVSTRGFVPESRLFVDGCDALPLGALV